MMEELPADILEKKILAQYLVDDGLTVGRLSLCSTGLYQRINRSSSQLWKLMIESRWTVPVLQSSSYHGMGSSSDGTQENIDDDSDYCSEFIRRYEIDMKALRLLDEMKTELQETLTRSRTKPTTEEEEAEEETNSATNTNDGIPTTPPPMMFDGSPTVGRAWDHPSWKKMLVLREECMDILKSKCEQPRAIRHKQNDVVGNHDIQDPLQTFLAARCLQNLNFAECLHEWKRIDEEYQDNRQQQHQLPSSIFIEKYALLICRIQQCPPDLIDENAEGCLDISSRIGQHLDDIANTCMEKINDKQVQSSTAVPTIEEKMDVINDVLVNTFKFEGNTADYYNYRNSLLGHTLKTKKAIPITLAILYVCICRRCGIDNTHLVGLPGHVVLGYYTTDDDNEDHQLFLDVFRKGQKLTKDDCMQICNSYGYPWNPDYVTPLKPAHILQRMLNNLNNCHFQAMASNHPFHSELFFQQRALDTIHRQPSDIACPLVERVAQEIPLTLSPDLLRYYNLLSPTSASAATTTATTD